uniref:phospholipase A2 n=1 Tax=Oryzias latipes TaxID=8090 RepID=A0A3P9LT87_ORYLA
QRSGIFLNGLVSHLILTQLNNRKAHKQTATESCCSKGLAEHSEGENPASGDVHEFKTSGCHCQQRVFNQILVMTILFSLISFSAPTRGDGTVRKTRRKRSSWLFPGTLWCGTGSRARRYDQLGMFERADVCCREHDHCQHSIPALSVSYGVFNHHFFTVSHCNCDQRFRQCLKRMNDSVSSMIGYTFFSVLQVPCFELQHVKRCTEMYWWGMCKRAKEAPYAVFQKSRPFDKSDSQHKHTHVGITSSEEQHLTKIKRVESERKSSKAKPRCEPRDPPRGDTFHRRRKTGKRCRTQKNLEEVSSLKESTESGAPTRSMPKKNGPSKRKTHGLKKESRAMKKTNRKRTKIVTYCKKITFLSFFFFPENHLKCESLKHLDDCKFKIFPLQGKHNLHNKDFKTIIYFCHLILVVLHLVFRCSGGFIKAFHLLEALKKAEEKSKAEMGFSASERKRRIPVRLYKRCMRLQKEFEKMSELG